MAGDTAIEWADATWNPIVGCQIVSPGCKHCYAMGQAARIERMAAGAGRETHYAGTTQPSKAGPVWTGKVALAGEQALTAPLRWTKPRRIFVNSMGDLFADGVEASWLEAVWSVMAASPHHTFIVLTKRAERMRAVLSDDDLPRRVARAWCSVGRNLPDNHVDWKTRCWNARGQDSTPRAWPLPNVWLGVTAEDQPRAEERIPELLQTPAAKRIVSVEPMIGPVDLTTLDQSGGFTSYDALRSYSDEQAREEHGETDARGYSALDWVIVGGESGRGPGIRPMHPSWARQVRDDCAAAGVPFFFKQWGEWAPGISAPSETPGAYAFGDYKHEEVTRPLTIVGAAPRQFTMFGARTRMTRVGKRAAGHVLDGVVHHAWPEACA